jgi:hypothetical protein
MSCSWFNIFVVGGIFFIVSIIRWFEQITEAVQYRLWNKTLLLLIFPPAVWFFPSRYPAGRPTPVPRHEPVRGFGSMPKMKPADDQPPPGTPLEFLVKPKVPPPKPAGPKPSLDADKLAKLKQKMREQGMLGDDK